VAKIVILEEDTRILRTMSNVLENEGHTVDGLHSVDETINFLRFEKPDLLILGDCVAQKNTTRVADFAMYANPNMPVICVTGSRVFADSQLFNMMRNVAWVLRKPLQMRDFVEIVQFSLERGLEHEKVFASI